MVHMRDNHQLSNVYPKSLVIRFIQFSFLFLSRYIQIVNNQVVSNVNVHNSTSPEKQKKYRKAKIVKISFEWMARRTD